MSDGLLFDSAISLPQRVLQVGGGVLREYSIVFETCSHLTFYWYTHYMSSCRVSLTIMSSVPVELTRAHVMWSMFLTPLHRWDDRWRGHTVILINKCPALGRNDSSINPRSCYNWQTQYIIDNLLHCSCLKLTNYWQTLLNDNPVFIDENVLSLLLLAVDWICGRFDHLGPSIPSIPSNGYSRNVSPHPGVNFAPNASLFGIWGLPYMYFKIYSFIWCNLMRYIVN